MPSFTKESEELSSRVASQDHEVGVDFCWQPATFDKHFSQGKMLIQSLYILPLLKAHPLRGCYFIKGTAGDFHLQLATFDNPDSNHIE